MSEQWFYKVNQMATAPKRKGKLARNEDGKAVLVNDDGKTFETDEIVIAIWNSLDGDLTVEEMAEDISEESGESEEDISGAITDIVDKLETVDLVKK